MDRNTLTFFIFYLILIGMSLASRQAHSLFLLSDNCIYHYLTEFPS